MPNRRWSDLSRPAHWGLVAWAVIVCPLAGVALLSHASSAGWINTEGAWPAIGIVLGAPAGLALVAALAAGRLRGASVILLCLGATAAAFVWVLVGLALLASSGALS